ncbi:ABC transporter substrate-binding protein [Bacillus sp. CGMCC 1.16541]|uniref:ABC transporter substrate-binding protein n=1 Tax=Bacillus sp. CGMCC 1.16541 TaxID=2185143 RepID=UPI001EF499A4|nr:ABC transporter substrate-binding protein [Bacillus sp. CGMCC 1.16541]
MKKHILMFVLLLSFAFVLGACSSSTNSDAKKENKVEESTKEDVKEHNKVEETRVVEHFKGKTEVPANPKKVVVLSHVSWEGSLVSVGVKPHAIMAYDGEFPPHLKEELQGVEPIPYADEINPEEIVKLNPDLLIISDRYEKIYDQLSAVVPTVVVEVGGDWKEDHLKVTEAVGKREEGQKVIDDLAKKAEETGQEIKKTIGDKKVMAVSINKKDIRVFGRTDHALNELLFEDLKLTPAEGLPEGFGENISMEGLSKYNPEFIIDVTYFNSGDYYKSVMEGEVWNSLEAVKNNQVYTLTTTWGFWDPIEREKGIDELKKLIVK